MLLGSGRLLFFMLEPTEAQQASQNIQRVVAQKRQQWQLHSPPRPVRRYSQFQNRQHHRKQAKEPETLLSEQDVLVGCSCRLALIVFQKAAQPLPTSHLVPFSEGCWSP